MLRFPGKKLEMRFQFLCTRDQFGDFLKPTCVCFNKKSLFQALNEPVMSGWEWELARAQRSERPELAHREMVGGVRLIRAPGMRGTGMLGQRCPILRIVRLWGGLPRRQVLSWALKAG